MDELFLSQRVRLGELFDVYGGLLTEKQFEICNELLTGDLSFGELAEAFDITRQAAFGQVSKARSKMEKIEESVHALDMKGRLEAIASLARGSAGRIPEDIYGELVKLADQED